jgi:hypothetical protein
MRRVALESLVRKTSPKIRKRGEYKIYGNKN